jgi:AraC-like DNA-binding protein
VAEWASTAAEIERHTHTFPRTEQEAAELLGALIRTLVPDTLRPAAMHPAISRALRLIPTLLERGEVRLELLAREADISASRLSHLFSQQVGTPLRPYVLWQRLMRVADHVRLGRTLTEAAQAAGFCDSAHFSRVFRRMFGMTPSVAWGAVEWSVLATPLTGMTT